MDEENFRRLFADPDYRPDMLKIYPTVVVERTALYRQWQRGDYRPLGLEEVVDLLAAVKAAIPPWVRIQRIQREINVPDIRAGPRSGNIRQLVRARMESSGTRCRCIRCREVGAATEENLVGLRTMEYEASGGKEVFLALEDEAETIYGYARLRLGSRAFLRELKVFGQVVAIGDAPGSRWQHRGFGSRLLRECEAIARSDGRPELLVTSGVGAREYYRRFGYERRGVYMGRSL
jgi:elongator complex protein 3